MRWLGVLVFSSMCALGGAGCGGDGAEPPPDGGPGLDAAPADASTPPDGETRDAGATDAAPADVAPADAALADATVVDAGTDAGATDGGRADGGSTDADVSDTGLRDVGPSDGGAADLGAPDLGSSDGGEPDAGPVDAGGADLGPPDVGSSDGGAPDVGLVDTGFVDLGVPDVGAADLGFADLGVLDVGRSDGGYVDLGAPDIGSSDAGGTDAATGSDLGVSDLGADAGAGDAGDAGFVNTGPLPCTARGWCWDNPVPRYGDFLGTWTDGTEGWLVGERGLALRFDGQRWRVVPTGTTEDLRAVWGASASDVWIVGGDDVILRWNGTALRTVRAPVRRPRPAAIHGSSASNVWIAGSTALRWDGTGLAADTSALGLADVFVATASSAYGVAGNGRILEWSGQTWTSTPSGTTRDLTAVFGAGGEVWAAGDRGTVRRRTASGWSAGPSIGRTFTPSDMWMSAPNDVWATTDRGGPLVRYDGSRWSVPSPRADRPLSAVWGASAQSVWVGGSSGFWGRWDGAAWSDGNAQRPLHAVVRTSTSGGDLYAAGLDNLLMRRDPSGWTVTAPFRRGDHYWGGFTGSGISWLLGDGGKIDTWNGTAFTGIRSFTSDTLRDAWASAPNAVWAVGDRGSQAFWDGMSWTRPSPGTSVDLRATWGSGPNDVWSVGAQAVITRWNGTRLSIQQVGSRSRLFEDVEGRSAQDVWVVGHEANGRTRDGVVLRYDGTSWSTVHTVRFAELAAVLLTGTQDVWVGTRLGTILHYDGTRWETVFESRDLVNIEDLWEDSSGRIWAVTQGGGVLFYDP